MHYIDWWLMVCCHLRIALSWSALEPNTSIIEYDFHHPAILCDSGSTGSRVFAIHVPFRQNQTGIFPVVELLGRTEVGISELARNGMFERAPESLSPLILRGIARLGASAPIYVFGTGGVRSLSTTVRTQLMGAIQRGLLERLSDVNHGPIHVRTVDGIDEALYGLLAANFLLNSVSIQNLTSPLASPIAVMDLGGSSLEVALVGDDMVAGTADDVLVSFKSLGLVAFRDKMHVATSERPCRFENVCEPRLTDDIQFIGQW